MIYVTPYLYVYMWCKNRAVTLDEPVKMRESGPNEDAQLNDFQVQLVQMAATLNGDHEKDTYPHKLVENMTVAEAVNYVNGAFKMFQDELEKMIGSVVEEAKFEVTEYDASQEAPTRRTHKSFAQKLFSCIICDN